MADGTLSNSSIYLAEVNWFNEKKEVSVISSSSEFGLLGMELLFRVKTTLEPTKNTLIIEPSFPKLL